MPSPAENITRHFGGDWHGSYGTFPTPGHDKRDRGMTVTNKPGAPDGVLINTMNGGDPLAVKDECRRLGLLPERMVRNEPWRETGVYTYRGYRTVRLEKSGEKKRFMAQRPDGKGAWINGIGDVPRVLYRADEVEAADIAQPVYLVEGERKADLLVKWGVVATAVAFGAKGWKRHYADALAGRTVVILPDNDDEGRGFAERAKADIISAGGIAVLLTLPGLPAKGDVIDWSRNGGSAFHLAQLTKAALQPEQADPLPGGNGPEEWENQKAPDRRFIVPGWIATGSAGLLGGQDGVGKSLLAQQLGTCAAAHSPFMGIEIERVKTLYITCEDDADELHRRQESINAALGVTMADLKGWLRTHSLKGELGNEMAVFNQNGQMTTTKRYAQIRQAALDFGARLVFVDNAAHVFAGNENARHDVAAFLGLLERLSIEIDGAVVLLAHPNKQHAQGNKQGNEYSGSTGWSAHVRNRLFLDWESGPDELPSDPDLRVLRRSKANYAARGEEIIFRWHKWAFVRDDDLPPNIGAELAKTIQATGENERFMECLAKATEDRRAVSISKNAANFAPRIFAGMPTARGMKVGALQRAMERLLHLGRIKADQKLWQRENRVWVMGIGMAENCQ